jgi:hypothetical protein
MRESVEDSVSLHLEGDLVEMRVCLARGLEPKGAELARESGELSVAGVAFGGMRQRRLIVAAAGLVETERQYREPFRWNVSISEAHT